jgi:putative transposase
MKYRRFTQDFKRSLIEQLLSEAATPWVATTDSNHGLSIYPNLDTDLTPSNVNQLWVADITYIRIFACFVYLAVILDAFSRKAIGYALSKGLDTRLALGALHMAISDRDPEPGCIHHSDRGLQYASRVYVKELTFITSRSVRVKKQSL